MLDSLAELEWARIRACIESMTQAELAAAVKGGTINKLFATAAFPSHMRRPALSGAIVDEALRMWQHLAKQ